MHLLYEFAQGNSATRQTARQQRKQRPLKNLVVRCASDYPRDLMTNDAHATPTANTQQPLYDVDIPTPTHAERARTLVAPLPTGTLDVASSFEPKPPYT